MHIPVISWYRYRSESVFIGSRVLAVCSEFSTHHPPPSRPSELNLQTVWVRANTTATLQSFFLITYFEAIKMLKTEQERKHSSANIHMQKRKVSHTKSLFYTINWGTFNGRIKISDILHLRKSQFVMAHFFKSPLKTHFYESRLLWQTVFGEPGCF